MIHLARELRKNQTPSERLLWGQLRSRGLKGYAFRRQHPIGPYIVDFCCLQKRLVIEVDGEIHSHPVKAASDQKRQEYIEREGFRVLRFTTEDVLKRLDGILVVIQQELAKIGSFV